MRLNLTLFSTVLPALFISPVATVGNVAPQTEATDRPAIASIRQQYAAINKRSQSFRNVKKKLSGFSLEGGELVAYFDGPSVVKIVATYYGESGRSVEDYYYSHGKLIFVFRKNQRYDRPLSGKVVLTEQTRFYFANDRLIRWVDEKGNQVSLSTDEAQQKQKDYLEISGKFLAGARSKGAIIEAE